MNSLWGCHTIKVFSVQLILKYVFNRKLPKGENNMRSNSINKGHANVGGLFDY